MHGGYAKVHQVNGKQDKDNHRIPSQHKGQCCEANKGKRHVGIFPRPAFLLTDSCRQGRDAINPGPRPPESIRDVRLPNEGFRAITEIGCAPPGRPWPPFGGGPRGH